MPRRKPTASASSHARRAIASAAARLMAEHGIADYGMAKRKAARSLGVGEGEALPTNEEIEAELRAWQSLYQEDEQRERFTTCAARRLR
jgi:broad specificity phosphatase PhoE